MSPVAEQRLTAVAREPLACGRRVYFVDWNLGNDCQYACSYCPKRLHDGSEKPIELQTSLEFCRWIADAAQQRALAPHIHFSGGEPTIYPGFEALVGAVHEHGWATLSMVSNGARPVAWWRRMAPFFESITLSAHVEYVRLERFLTTAVAINEATALHINIPAPPEHFDACLGLFERVAERVPHASITLKPILKGFSETLADYSDEQLEQLRVGRRNAPTPKGEARGQRPLMIHDASGSSVRGSASGLVVNGLNGFKGWSCDAGLESLAVLLGGDIYRAVCKEGGKVGSLRGDFGALPAAPVICNKSRCKCLTDIPIRKYAGEPGA